MLKSPFGNGPTRSSHSVFLCPSSYLSHLCKHTRTCLFDSLHLAFQFLFLIETVYPSQPITTIEYMSYCNNAKLKTMVPSLKVLNGMQILPLFSVSRPTCCGTAKECFPSVSKDPTSQIDAKICDVSLSIGARNTTTYGFVCCRKVVMILNNV